MPYHPAGFPAWRQTCLLAAAIIFSPGCMESVPGPLASPEMDSAVTRLATLKSEAEQWAKTIKADYPPATPERRKAEALYIAASAGVNGWIATFKLQLAEGRQPTPESAGKQLDAAAVPAQAYVTYVNQLYVRNATAAQTVTLIGDVYKILADICTKVTDYDNARRKRISDIIDTLQWKPINEI